MRPGAVPVCQDSIWKVSRIGKMAENDLVVGVGRHENSEDDEPDHTRYLTVSKNKLSGWHGTVICRIQPEISRYVE